MYGENSGAIRAQLAALLRQHRIQQRIGGPGIYTVPVTTTVSEREEMARLIQHYRLGVLTWCRQALDAVAPTASLDRRERPTRPDVELRRVLGRSLRASTTALPTLEDLGKPHEFGLVEAWRLAARAAALGEHDFDGDLARGRLDLDQCLTVAKDAAETIRGLVVLDRRYRHVPGWHSLPMAAPLERAAETCSFLQAADYTVDLRGRRVPSRTIGGPPRPGLQGVVQAEHNMLVHLHHAPTALNLRLLLDSQREISHLLAVRTQHSHADLSRRWAQRASTYKALQRAARDLGGSVGAGSAAVIEAANAVSRLHTSKAGTATDRAALQNMDLLFGAVDQRLADIIEQGARDRVYFLRAKLPRLVESDGQLVHEARSRFAPITSPMSADLTRLVSDRLRPAPAVLEQPAAARASREELAEALVHRPISPQRRSAPRGPSL